MTLTAAFRCRWVRMAALRQWIRSPMALAFAALALGGACGQKAAGGTRPIGDLVPTSRNTPIDPEVDRRCREDYDTIPARKRLETEPDSPEVKQAMGDEIRQWMEDHPECRP